MAGKALIVEDESGTGELLSELLRRRGFQPTVLAEGKPALDWVRTHRPEIILLDLMLPDIDGFTICEQLKLDRQTNLIPVIMVTALDDRRNRLRGYQVGANRYVTKPFTGAQIDKAVTEALTWRADMLENGAKGEIHFQLQSDTQYLDELNKLLTSLFLYSGLAEAQVKQLTLAVRELGANAIEWGHQKQVERIVTMTYRIDAEKITIVIRDTGPGFKRNELAHAAREDDPVSHMEVREKLGLREGGFGIMIANGLLDKLEYNESGNEVRLVKYFPPKDGEKGK